MVLALAAVTVPLDLLRLTVLVAAVLVLYVGVVVCLRAAGLMTTDHSIPRLHKREVFGAFAAVVVAAGLTAFVAVGIVAAEHQRTPGEPEQPGLQRLHRAVRAAAQPDRVAREPQRHVVGGLQLPRRRAHHHDPRAAQRRRPLPHDRRLLRLRRQRSRAHEPRRRREPRPAAQGARRGRRCASSTGSARSPASPTRRARSRTSTSATTSASSARSRRSRCSTTSTTFLDRNLTDVVVIDIEDYVQPKDLKQALIDNGLWDRVWKPNPKQIGWPSLYDMVATKTKAQEKVGERPRGSS